jgi:tetratricopeptide (TPR) repeat protein
LELAPDSAEAHFAQGLYSYWALRDYEGALSELTAASRLRPNDVDIATYSHAVLRRQGHWEQAISTLEQAQAFDPQNPYLLYDLAESYGFLRRYADARPILDTVISLAPDMDAAYALRAWHSMLAGSLDQARGTLKDAPRQDHESIALRWTALELQARDYEAALRRLTEAPDVRGFAEGVLPRTLLEAWVYRLMDREERAQPLFEAARVFLENWVEDEPEDWRARQNLALAYAELGRKADAIREANAASELLPVSRDAVLGPMPRLTLAKVYATVGEHDAAINEVSSLLSIPAYFSVWELRLDPVWDPLRDDPRFKELVGEDWKAETSP